MNIVGHTKIINQLDKAIENGTFSHAYLFAGPESVGKFTLAKEVAKKMLKVNNLELCSDYILVEPEVEEEKGKIKIKDISVEKLRDMAHQLNITAAGKFKIAIINDAHRLTISAQNSLLKILEEPPAGAIIFLITHNKDKLLPTILSRCQAKKFGFLTEKELAEMVGAESNKNELIFWSLGRPGLLREMLDNHQRLEDKKSIIDNLQNVSSSSLVEKFELAEKMSKNIPETEISLNLWMVYLRECLLEKKDCLIISSEKAMIIISKITEALKVIKNTNTNARLVLENLFLEL